MAERICSDSGCNRPVGRHGGRGLCPRHYMRLRRLGTTSLPTAADRFWKKVNREGPVPEHRPELGPCWLWTGATALSGYGRFTLGGAHGPIVQAHRFAYELLVGPIPAGLELDHLCAMPPCVNPAHAEPVTGAENNRRSRSRSAENLRKTHCPQGHPYDQANTYWYRGHRHCRTCWQ
ncbi:MAG TPA: HNH endonuclease signature motif containing protein [Actinomycetes bacterium]|nr:HNH endonuclease signature motif containing protein [Actinomycetes bacterium]